MSGDTPTDQSMYEAVLEAAAEPLWVVNSDGSFEVVNRAFVELTGYGREELLGMTATAVFENGGNDWEHRKAFLYEVEPGTVEQWFGRINSKNGTEIPVEWHCQVISRNGGKAIAGRLRDLRKERQQERKLNVLNRVLRHNIRNQVNIILGKSSMLQEINDEGYSTAARKIEAIGEEIINISDKARRAQQHIGIPLDEDCRIDLVKPTEQAIRTFRIKEPTATVRTEIPSQAFARAPPAFDVALQELLENAVLHSEDETAPVDVEISVDEEQTRVRVRDECEPIPAEVTETIGRGSEQPLHHNDGLGLWIVQWIVDAVDGELSFSRREDDRGNVVTLTFETLASEELPNESGIGQANESDREIR